MHEEQDAVRPVLLRAGLMLVSDEEVDAGIAGRISSCAFSARAATALVASKLKQAKPAAKPRSRRRRSFRFI
jgi:hypothetical protein